jgi:lipopolysaccharide/colanic/teichoic acid biosynthesis glycosyltransferase
LLELTERLLACILLVALAPAMALIAASIKVLSGRSPLVAHRRIGYEGEVFWLLKFRTMWNGEIPAPGAPRLVEYVVDENGPNRKRAGDPRVTHPFARFCRRHSLDELPQLVHVAAGRMSFVGPRPLTRTELNLHYKRIAPAVLSTNPGLTGLWQVMGRNRLSYRSRARLDLFYVNNRSIGLYFTILARTIPQLIAAKNSW